MNDHTHEHTHTHDHTHAHQHEGNLVSSPEEQLALLSYMVSHNQHHCEEIAGLAETAEGPAREALQNAIRLFEEGNQQLARALDILKTV